MLSMHSSSATALRMLYKPGRSCAFAGFTPKRCAVSALTQTNTHMSDPEKSGTPSPAPADLSAQANAPAEAAPATNAAPAPVSPPAAFGSFGATRGSGLARG